MILVRAAAAEMMRRLIKTSGKDTPILDNYGVDLTKAAAEGVLDPIVGRHDEIERMAQILTRRKRIIPY